MGSAKKSGEGDEELSPEQADFAKKLLIAVGFAIVALLIYFAEKLLPVVYVLTAIIGCGMILVLFANTPKKATGGS